MSTVKAEPVNRNFFGQASDQAVALALMPQQSVEAIFKLNCLFFDHLTLGTSDMLGNSVLFNLFVEEPNAMSRLFRSSKKGGLGIFQPILADQLQSAVEVAESMIKSKVIHSLKQAQLLKHADLISRSDPNYLWFDLANFRLGYYANMLEITRLINRDGLVGGQSSLPQKGELKRLEQWLMTGAPVDNLRETDVFRFIETGGIKRKRPAKRLAELVFQYSLAHTQFAALSLPAQSAPIISGLAGLRNTFKPTFASGAEKEELQLKILLPVQDLIALPMRHIIEIRELPAFRIARRLLAKFRWAVSSVDIVSIQAQMDQCAEQLITYATGTELQRCVLVKAIQDQRRSAAIKLIKVAALSGTRLLFVLTQARPIAAIASYGLDMLSAIMMTNSRTYNAIHPESNAEVAEYLPASGTL
jgi:hypothetical protein